MNIFINDVAANTDGDTIRDIAVITSAFSQYPDSIMSLGLLNDRLDPENRNVSETYFNP